MASLSEKFAQSFARDEYAALLKKVHHFTHHLPDIIQKLIVEEERKPIHARPHDGELDFVYLPYMADAKLQRQVFDMVTSSAEFAALRAVCAHKDYDIALKLDDGRLFVDLNAPNSKSDLAFKPMLADAKSYAMRR